MKKTYETGRKQGREILESLGLCNERLPRKGKVLLLQQLKLSAMGIEHAVKIEGLGNGRYRVTVGVA